MRAARVCLWGVLAGASLGCTDGRREATAISVELAAAVHAPRVVVPWWWRGALPAGDRACEQLDAGVFAAFGDALEPAVVAIDRRSLRLGLEVVVALDEGRVPAGVMEDRAIAPLRGHLAAAIVRQKRFLSECGRPDTAVDLLIAVAPDVPSDTLFQVFYTAASAGIGRYFLAAGGEGGPSWQPEGFTHEEEKIVLRWRDGWTMDIGERRPPRVPLGSLDELADHIHGRLGCASLPARDGPWSATVADLDRLASFGARRFELEGLAGPSTTGAGVPGQQVALRVGGSVAAFPNVPPKFVDMATVPNWVDDGWNGLHPCEGQFVERARREEWAVPGLPGLVPGSDDEDVWKDLIE